MAYFEQTGEHTFRATEHVGGAWEAGTQHIAPALGLLVHAVETDRDARRGDRPEDRLRVSRLSFDILGTVPVAEVDVAVRVLRPGRTVELVEATLVHAGRAVVALRAWLLQPRDTGALQGTGLAAVPGPEEHEPWDPTTVWPGGFIASVEVRRRQVAPGRATFWVRTPVPLVADREVSRLAATAGLLDIANGMTVLADPRTVAFPNVDLTAHLVAEPRGAWVGFDTAVTFGADGLGLTHSVVHDETGPIGTSSQSLTVRPGAGL